MMSSRSNPNLSQHNAVNKHIGDFFMNMFHIAVPWFIAPLKAFQEFRGLYADGFGEVSRSVELVPISVCHELTNHIDG